ncbi:MAG TPA: site-2 protease family protein [Thermoanaerobaculia bacterium]
MIHLGSVRGTTLGVDFSFLILVGLWVASYYDPARGIQHALLWIPVLFLSVLIHELAHAATIGAFGYGPSEIVLGGIGGATMNRRVAKPWHDVIISLAGPVSSFALAFLINIIYVRVPFMQRDPMMVEFMPLLFQMNIWWGAFNLLPISPLDGGHAVRNFLRMFLKDRVAFLIAVWIAIVAGAAVVIWAIWARSILLAALISWYVFMNYQSWQYYRDHGMPGD